MPGEMAKLAGIIRPTLGIFANIGAAHSEGFENDQERWKKKFNCLKEQVLSSGARIMHW